MSSSIQPGASHTFRFLRGCVGAAVLFSAPWSAAVAQAPSPNAVVGQTSGTQPTKPLSPAEIRKQQITADTAHLQQLAEELKAEMDKSTKDTLSMGVVKKAAEIEKLAHKVREEIRASLVD